MPASGASGTRPCPWTNRSPPPSLDVGGRPYSRHRPAVPWRAHRELPTQLVEHALESFARTSGTTLHLSGSGRNDHHLAEAAFKALARALRVGLRARSATGRRRLDQGRTRVTGPTVAVVDYGAGNLVSIEQALTHVGASVTVARDPSALAGADALIVPGVGAAAPAMERLQAAGLVDPILAWISAGRPFLGVCLGLQLLFDASDEDDATTLGVLGGRTSELLDAPTLPHIGWNQVVRSGSHPLFDGIDDGADFYFVHSYAGAPEDPTVVAATTEHGRPFVSAIARGPLLGVQFHPERSGEDGLRLLANFTQIVRATASQAA